jgi:pimeloyl-ACP methyl ester carboxylesterase
VISVPLGFDVDFRDYRRRIIDAVQAAFPSSDSNVTTMVDVVGYSMGGIAAEYSTEAARPGEPARRLRIARLFTISSPLTGAVEAESMPQCPIILDRFQTNLKAGSEFRHQLDIERDLSDLFPVYSYVALGDRTVGARNAAVPGQTAWWVSQPLLMSAHDTAYADPRIQADIVRRLRGEEPFTRDPPAPLPRRERGEAAE